MNDAPQHAAQAPDHDRFLPRFLREHCATQAERRADYAEWSLHGALLFVDLVGFTGRVEQLVAQGPEGVELANELLNQSIGALVTELIEGGGDVTAFAGDALFVLWSAQADEASLVAAIGRASACALAALERRRRPEARDQPALRFSLGAGAFQAHELGGHAQRWHCLLSGPAFEQVGHADALACNDALLAAPEVVRLAGTALRGEPMPGDVLRVRAAQAVKAGSENPPVAASARARLHLPQAVAAQRELRWLAEFRHPSVIFARLPGLLREGRLDGPLAQRATQLVQGIVAELDGTTLQFVIDDKGPVFVIAFGLAAQVHEDDPARAALAALRIVTELQAQGIACGAGVATGRAYCGLIGTDTRCNYTLIGQTLNLAARLMQRATPGPLCDQRTQELSRSRVEFAHEGVIRVKGLDAPVPHYRALATHTARAPAETAHAAPPALIGRSRELDILEGQLDALLRERRCALVVLVGEAGIGKSRLVQELLARARSATPALVAAAGIIESAPHVRWRPVLNTLLERLRSARPASAAALEDDAFLRAFLGHTREALPDLDDAERAHRTREAIARVVLHSARHAPLLLCVEDTHWMDSLSWSVITRLVQGQDETGIALLLVLTTRELEDHAPADALARLQRSGMLRLPLGPLATEDRALVAGSAIGAQALSAEAARWIAAHSGGNPLFCRELAVAAIESGELRLREGRAELSPLAASLDAGSQLPHTLQGLIASRLDRLNPAQQQILRTAAVIGVRFSSEALTALHDTQDAAVDAELAALQHRGLLDHPSVAAGYAFHHALVRDAAYDSLPYRRRRELHARLAAWLEQRFADDLAPQAAVLAHHWERAEAWEQAFAARLRAGEVALRSYSNREAVEHFEAARALRARRASLRSPVHASAPELGLAHARHRMGDERASRKHLLQALGAAGELLPASRPAQIWSVLRELLWRALPLTPRRPAALRSATRLRAAVEAYDLLPDILYYDNDPLALSHVVLRFLRLAEAEPGSTPERARALGWFALLKSGLGSRPAVDHTLDRALAVARACGDPVADAWLRLARGSVLAQFGAWTEAEHWLRDARARYAAIGDRSRGWNATSGLGHVLSYRGQLAAGAEVMAEALTLNRDTDNPVFLCWGLAGHAEILHRLGDPAQRGEVVRRLRAAREALHQRPDAAADLFSRGVLAAALWRDEQREEALDLCRDTIAHALDRAPVVWLQIGSYLGLCEVLRALAREADQRGAALRLMQRLERSLRAFARLIPVARPTLGLLRGEIELLRGQPQRAQRALQPALRNAQALGLAMETGQLHLALAATLAPAEAALERDRAVAVFARIDARFKLREASPGSQYQALDSRPAREPPAAY